MDQPQGKSRPRAALAGALAATAVFVVSLVTGAALPAAKARQDSALPAAASRAVFERRLLPLFAAKNPSTCAECHLSGVSLQDYVRPSEAQTFASLRDAGLINMAQPENSRILRFIQMSRPKSPLVNQKVRAVEYQAFRDWIVSAVRNPRLSTLPLLPSSRRAGPAVPNSVIRHTRMDTVVASFTRNIWSQQGRCMNCHQAGTPDNDAKVKQFGPRVAWFKPDSAEETMHTLTAQGDVDVNDPAQSLILLKPLGKVPHGGGIKMIYGDAGYKMFRAWVEDYAASLKGDYRTARDLPVPPKETLEDLKCILALTGGPADWKDRSLRVDIYPWEAATGTWAARPVSTGERGMFAAGPGQPTGSNLILFRVVPADATPAEKARLEAGPGLGRYLLKYYCATQAALNQDYRVPTDSAAFYQGAQEVTAAWNRGAGWGAPVPVQVSLPPGRS